MEQKVVDLSQEATMVKTDIGTQGIKTYSEVQAMNLKLNPNTLQFKKSEKEEVYKESLLQTNENELKGQLKFNIILFTAFYLFICILCLTVNVYNLVQDKSDSTVILSQIIFSGILIFQGVILTTLIQKFAKARKYMVVWLSIMLITFQAYLIILDKGVIEGLLNITQEQQLDHSLILVATFYVSYFTLVSTHLGITILCFSSWILYCAFSIFKKEDLITNICNILAFGFISFLFALNGYKKDRIMRALFLAMKYNTTQSEQQQIFLKNEVMDDKSKKKLKTLLIKTHINRNENLTEMDRISITLHEVMTTLDDCSQIIIYNDVQSKLEKAYKQVQSVLKTLLSKDNLFEVNIEQKFDRDQDFTEENKAFIKEQYFSPTTQNDQSDCRKLKRRSTITETQKGLGFYAIEEPTNYKRMLQQTGMNWNFDMFLLQKWTNKQGLSKMTCYIMETLLSAEQVFKIPQYIYQKYFQILETKYLDNPYHNSMHAADVCNSMIFFIMNSELKDTLDNLDNLSSVIACSGHDVAHPGLNNRFLVNNQEKMAVKYNDISVLENMHSSVTFQVMRLKNEYNILKHLSKQDQLYVRKTIIDMILETDMSKHFSTLSKFKAKTENLKSEFSIENNEDKILILQILIKGADIGHSSKEWDLHYKWSMKICEEFFNQGDIEKERGQQISMYCDRSTTIIPQSQAGFLKFVCIPLYDTMCLFLKSEPIDECCLVQVGKNLVRWQQQDYKNRKIKTIGQKSMKEVNIDSVQKGKAKSRQTQMLSTKEPIDVELFAQDYKLNKKQNSLNLGKKKVEFLNDIIEEKMADEVTHLGVQDNSFDNHQSDKNKNAKSSSQISIESLLNDLKMDD